MFAINVAPKPQNHIRIRNTIPQASEKKTITQGHCFSLIWCQRWIVFIAVKEIRSNQKVANQICREIESVASS